MKKALRFFAGGLLASVAFASTAAFAAPVTFTISGLFDGTVNGESFSSEYVTFQGIGDTNNKVVDSTGTKYNLSSFVAYHSTDVYDFGAGMYFGLTSFTPNANLAAFGKPGALDPIFGNAALLFVFGIPGGYDGSFSVPLTPVAAVIPFGSTFSGPDFTGGAITNATALNFSISVAAVPEMDTWGLLMMGCGAVGYAMRRRARMNVAVRYA